MASTADSATHAGDADYATNAGSAGYATTAGDADTVDGQHASSFAAAVHTHDNRYYTKAHVDSLESRIGQLETTLSQSAALLQNVTRSGDDITFTGVNLHLVNGTGTTDGTVNGLGNLIVGYNELRGAADDRSGSHNIVVGVRHNYTSHSGLVVGYNNAISGAYASISGGAYNIATSYASSVSGGYLNQASGSVASVSGGWVNTAGSSGASCSGGYSNTARGGSASVSGGSVNTASGSASSVSGGQNNEASGEHSSILGVGNSNPNYGNKAFGNLSAVLGGYKNIAGDEALLDHTIGEAATVFGGTLNVASGLGSNVCGGWENRSTGMWSCVSGGWSRQALNESDWAPGACRSYSEACLPEGSLRLRGLWIGEAREIRWLRIKLRGEDRKWVDKVMGDSSAHVGVQLS